MGKSGFVDAENRKVDWFEAEMSLKGLMQAVIFAIILENSNDRFCFFSL